MTKANKAKKNTTTSTKLIKTTLPAYPNLQNLSIVNSSYVSMSDINIRTTAITEAIKLFMHTDFMRLLKGKDDTVMDVPFFMVIEEFYNFLSTGKLKALDNYRNAQNRA